MEVAIQCQFRKRPANSRSMHNTVARKAAGGKKVFKAIGIAANDHVSVEQILGIMPPQLRSSLIISNFGTTLAINAHTVSSK